MGSLANLPNFQPATPYSHTDFNEALANLTLANNVVGPNEIGSEAAAVAALLEKAPSPIIAPGTDTIDCSAGTFFKRTVAATTTFVFTNAPAGAYGFTLEVVHAAGAITWPAAVTWPNDIAPTLTAGKTHLLAFITTTEGTRWRGAAMINYTN